MSENEVLAQAAGLKHLLVPEFTSIIEVDGKPICAGLGLLDYNPSSTASTAFVSVRFLALVVRQEKLKRIRLMSTNVVPEYQRWGFGLFSIGTDVKRAAGSRDYSR